MSVVELLARELIKLEWTAGPGENECPACPAHGPTYRARDGSDPQSGYFIEWPAEPHAENCTLDRALTAAGYPDQASREAVRGIVRGA